ncbi:MAG: ABC transporter permease [Candidatus Solibacter sp.]
MSSRIESSSLAQLTKVRFLEFLREPEAIFWTFIFPVLLAAGLGIAFRNQPAQRLKIGTTDAQLAASLRQEKGLDVLQMDAAAGDAALRTGRIALLAKPAPDGVVYRYDDTNAESRNARLLADRAMHKASGQPDPVKATDDLVREPGSRYIDFLVPGLLGMNLMGGGIWGLGFSIVDARRKNLLKRLAASPMAKWEYLVSFLLSRLVMLCLEVLVFVGFAVLVFGVPLRGSLTQLAALCLLASLSFSALGLLISSRVRTIEAVSGLMNVVMLPMWVLSGIFFSAERFPDAVQPLIRVLPLTAVIEALRGNMLQGLSLAQLSGQLTVMMGWLVFGFAIALRLFRWR